MPRILIINPGATSTKLGIYENDEIIWKKNFEHSAHTEDLLTPEEKVKIRAKEIEGLLSKEGFKIEEFDAIACRGGILPPLESGTYEVDEEMVDYLLHKTGVDHPSNLAAPIGRLLSRGNIPVYITDPVSVDEFWDEARLSGIPQIERRSLFHALNMKAVARKVAEEMGKPLEELNFVIAHLGGGISVGLQVKGKMVDVNNANDEGPFSPNRTGELPVGDVVEMAFSGKYTEKELLKRYTKQGGLLAYLGTDDLRKAMELAANDPKAELVIEGMAYQIAKEIGGMCAVAGGNIDAIILTGGMAYNSDFVEKIKSYVARFALVVVEPGENELLALAEGAKRVLTGKEKPKRFKVGETI